MKTKDGLEVCHNVQTAVDSKNKMIAEFQVSSQVQDKNLMGAVAVQAAELLGADHLTVVAYAGYDGASDVAALIENGFTSHVAGANYDICIPCSEEDAERILDYETGRCVYIPARNIFICPLGQILYLSGFHKRNHMVRYRVGVELKSPSREETDASAAYRQLRNYMHEIPSLFIYNAVCVMSDMTTSNEEVIEELLKLAKDIAAANAEGEALGLNAEELAFYDALTKPEAIKDFYEHEELIAITKELTDLLRKNRTIDWQKKESARAGMRKLVKRLLKRHKYPPEGMEDAVQTVMSQCEMWTDNIC